MPVLKLDNVFRDSSWRQAFARRLITLRPEMNPDAADEVSDSEFALDSSLLPEAAAERYVGREAALAAREASGAGAADESTRVEPAAEPPNPAVADGSPRQRRG